MSLIHYDKACYSSAMELEDYRNGLVHPPVFSFGCSGITLLWSMCIFWLNDDSRGCIVALYAPPTILRNNAYSIAFFVLFQMGCVSGCILMEKWVKSAIFNITAMKKCRNIKNRNCHRSNSNYHNYTNFTSKYMFLRVTNKMQLFLKFLLIIKGFKIQDGRQLLA